MRDKLAGKIVGKHYEPLAEWQKRNCTGCRFAEKRAVGTGKACCTYYLQYELDDKGECKTKRKEDE